MSRKQRGTARPQRKWRVGFTVWLYDDERPHDAYEVVVTTEANDPIGAEDLAYEKVADYYGPLYIEADITYFESA